MFSGNHLKEDASDGSNIILWVGLTILNHFRWNIPWGSCKIFGYGLSADLIDVGWIKVEKLYFSISLHHYIIQLQISVNDIIIMHPCHNIDYLAENLSNGELGEPKCMN